VSEWAVGWVQKPSERSKISVDVDVVYWVTSWKGVIDDVDNEMVSESLGRCES
jgi:hypothetical protein